MWKLLGCCLAVVLIVGAALAFDLVTESQAEAQPAPSGDGPWKVVKGVPVDQWAAHMNALDRQGWGFHSATGQVLIFKKK